jgi:hypothetical protein
MDTDEKSNQTQKKIDGDSLHAKEPPTSKKQDTNHSLAVHSASGEGNNFPDKDLLWKRVQLLIDLYKHYLDLTLKFDAFYYLATGGILSFYFSRPNENLIKYSLLFPVLMSIGFGILFIIGAYLNQNTARNLSKLVEELGFDSPPAVQVLSVLLVISAILMFIVAGVLAWLFYTR